MTEFDGPGATPFWQHKRLEEMTDGEWESLCDGCGRCCLAKLQADDSGDVYHVDVGCELLDTATGRCSDYANRLSRNVGCSQMTPRRVPSMDWLPPTCGYRRVLLGRPLKWWHPLVSGDPNTVHEAGISAAGRVIKPWHAGPLEYHTVDWPAQDATDDVGRRWIRAIFGGINASVPMPFGENNQIDLDLMAAQCFWLLANGCHGLAVLDNAGEVAALTLRERIGTVAGLVSRGVPVSKLLVGIGPASALDSIRLAEEAGQMGVRAVLIRVEVNGAIIPSEVLAKPTRDLLQALDPMLHVYLSLSARSSAVAACLTALESFVAHAPARLRGIRDETTGCKLGLAALEHFRGRRFEVYTADATALGQLVQHGGAGLISPSANLLGRLLAVVMQGVAPSRDTDVQRTIAAACEVLRPGPAVATIKALLARHCGKSEWNKVRLPIRALRDAEREALFRAFDATGIQLRAAT